MDRANPLNFFQATIFSLVNELSAIKHRRAAFSINPRLMAAKDDSSNSGFRSVASADIILKHCGN